MEEMQNPQTQIHNSTNPQSPESTNQQFNKSTIQQTKPAPNAVASMILGILSLLSGCLMVGLILGIVGLVLANNGMKTYNMNPSGYSGFGMLKAGKITSIIGIVFGAIAVVGGIISAIFVGGELFFLADLLDL